MVYTMKIALKDNYNNRKHIICGYHAIYTNLHRRNIQQFDFVSDTTDGDKLPEMRNLASSFIREKAHNQRQSQDKEEIPIIPFSKSF